MICESITLKESNLKYYIGISQIQVGISFLNLENFIDLINNIQKSKNGLMIQFFNATYVLDLDHILNACYYTIKSFKSGTNISNQINLEFLLYLASKRQIKRSLKDFGITHSHLSSKKLNYCIISP